MAIVVRSDRDFQLSLNNSSIIGPGEYEKNNSLENIPQNQAPFNIKSNKFFNFGNNINSEIGPGSYYNPKQGSFVRKSFNRNKSSMESLNKKDLYNLALFKVINGKKEIKLKEQKSLIINKENKNQVINNNNKFSLRSNSPKYYCKIIPTTLTKNRVNSIPSKEHCLGYDFSENGTPMIVDPPLNIKKDDNEKRKEKINSLDWSKMSKKVICSDNNEYPSSTKENSINNNSKAFFRNYSTNKSKEFETINSSNILKIRNSSNESSNIIKRSKNENESLSSFNDNNNNELNSEKNSSIIYKTLSEDFSKSNNNSNIYKKINKSKIKGNIYKTIDRDYLRKKESNISLEDLVYNNLFKGDPGPGYYQSQSDFDKYNYFKNKISKFNFGSNEKKNIKLYNSSENILGPGEYFKEEKTPKFKSNFFPFFRKEDNINIKKYEKDLVNENMGPGKYDIKSQFDKTQIFYSGAMEKRFLDLNKIIKPGPGEYLQLIDWEKNINQNKASNLINIKKDNKNEDKEEKGRHGYILKNDNPGVGNYNPHIINSIKYNIISRDNKVSNLIAPFYSGQEKYMKRSSSTSDVVGPGSYFLHDNNMKFRKEEDKRGMYLIKNNDIKKEKIKYIYNQIKSNIENRVGPGTYNLNNYNDWNKKTFNMLYA